MSHYIITLEQYRPLIPGDPVTFAIRAETADPDAVFRVLTFGACLTMQDAIGNGYPHLCELIREGGDTSEQRIQRTNTIPLSDGARI